jgi:hypothetical protein
MVRPIKSWSLYQHCKQLIMSDHTNLRHKDLDTLSDEQKEWYRDSMRNWRSWGSWFSWGSPIGLGIWFLCVAGTIWIIVQAFR